VAAEVRLTHSTYALYEELAQVNNELVTAQRELARTVAPIAVRSEVGKESVFTVRAALPVILSQRT